MSDEPENLPRRCLRRLDEKMDRVVDDVGDLKRWVTSLEMSQARLHASFADLHGDFAGQSVRMDRMEARLERIKRRLDLSDAAA